MKRILGIGVNAHDHNTYDGVLHKQWERYTRWKKNIPLYKEGGNLVVKDFYEETFIPAIEDAKKNDSVVAFTLTEGTVQRLKLYKVYLTQLPNFKEIITYKPKKLWNYVYNNNVYYIDHHQSHAVYALADSKFDESDILAIDGGGARYWCPDTQRWTSQISCLFIDKTGHIENLTAELPLGYLWNLCCRFTGFKSTEAGKLMGLSAYGKLNDILYEVITQHHDAFVNIHNCGKTWNVLQGLNPENFKAADVAYTMQQYTLDKIKEIIPSRKTSDNLCISGGVAYNGYMNEMLLSYWKNVHVPPAPGDEGQAIGAYIHAEKMLNNNYHTPPIYGGESYEVDESIFDDDLIWERKSLDVITKEVAKEIANGAIVGWHQGRSESGNRALGNRSIVADPRNPNIKDIINSKVKLREDFRPFAPSVLEEHYKEYFDTNQPSPHMSRIMPVISDKIPGVTHIDGTARIQTVTKELNSKYYQLINAFYEVTGIPMLLNTSFNCQEPIVETPLDAVKTFKKCGLDILVINDYIVKKKK